MNIASLLAAFVLTQPMLTAASSGSSAPPVGYALVVTNNRSLELDRPDLHFADDDGIQYARLFGQFLGESHVSLLTELDAESRRLYPEWQGRARPPTLANVVAAVANLASQTRTARAEHDEVHVYLVFAGHGDVTAGQGFVELRDGRLTARMLEEEIIARIPATRIHLILDSCNSFFMLNPRKPGGKRWTVTPDASEPLLDKYPHLGAIISTSAEALTYEWSELQSGIFSYVVRSGLRGGADADGDGGVSYVELAGFVMGATEPVVNDLYRPKVFFRGPDKQNEEPILRLPPQGARTLRLAADQSGRVTIRDEQGVRVVDVHPEMGTPTLLHLPADSPANLIVAYAAAETAGAARAGGPSTDATADDRRTMLERRIPGAGHFNLDELEASPAELAQRGTSPVFRALFSRPFGQQALAAFVATNARGAEVFYGVTTHDVERLDHHLRTLASFERDSRFQVGLMSLGLAGVMAVWTPWLRSSVPRERRDLMLGVGAGSAGALALLGTLALAIPSEAEGIQGEFQGLDFSSEKSRAEHVVKTELELKGVVDDWTWTRHLLGWGTLTMGGLLAASSGLGFYDAARDHRRPGFNEYGTLGVALATAGIGAYMLTSFRYPVERTWELYESDTSVLPRPALDQPAGLSLAPALSRIDDTWVMGMGGSF